jgi:formylglycine-generating enzyme required for sulfatase activity
MKKMNCWQTILALNLLMIIGFFSLEQITAQTVKNKKLSSRQLAQQTLPSTALLVMNNSITKKTKSGSGFFVAEDVIATNFHVIKETTEGYIKIYGQEKIYEISGILAVDEKNDLALLKIKGVRVKPLKLNTNNSTAIGDDVFAVGNPEGLEGTFSQGIVSGIRKSENVNLLQITAPISPGSSGGAVINDKGEVIGIAVGAIERGQSLNFAIPISLLNRSVLNQKSLESLRTYSVIAGTTRKNSLGIEFVYIPPGEFMMGSDFARNEKPIHKVTIKKGFWMSKYEITQKQWEQVMDTTLRQQKDRTSPFVQIKGEGPNYPMYFVNWEETKEFIKQLNNKTLFDDELVYSLPSEAEWEYSARAGSKDDFYGNPDNIGWYASNSEGMNHIVGQKLPNAFGLYDMSGNVFEWCEDNYVDGYAFAPTDGTAFIAQNNSTNRVMRGGSWFFPESFLRVNSRNEVPQKQRGNMYGFRVLARETINN